jgi:hypothetical protein
MHSTCSRFNTTVETRNNITIQLLRLVGLYQDEVQRYCQASIFHYQVKMNGICLKGMVLAVSI